MYQVRVVSEDFARGGINVVIGIRGRSESDSTVVVTQLSTDYHKTQALEPHVVAPAIFLSDEIARPLLDALAAHYGGSGDTRMLRRDYDAERKRVDTLVEALIEQGRGQVVLMPTGEVR